MAINRKDTPLANTPDPTIDPTAKRTVTVNPNGTKTYKMSWVTNESKNTPSRRSSGKVVSKGTSKGISGSKSRGASGTSSSKPTQHEIEYSTLPEVKTKGVIEKKPEIKTNADASALTRRGDNRTWQERRKQEERRKEYNKYKEGDESFSEYRERAKKASEEISRKAKPKGKGFLRASTSNSGGGGGCHSC
jgi:hypothetical protein